MCFTWCVKDDSLVPLSPVDALHHSTFRPFFCLTHSTLIESQLRCQFEMRISYWFLRNSISHEGGSPKDALYVVEFTNRFRRFKKISLRNEESPLRRISFKRIALRIFFNDRNFVEQCVIETLSDLHPNAFNGTQRYFDWRVFQLTSSESILLSGISEWWSLSTCSRRVHWWIFTRGSSLGDLQWRFLQKRFMLRESTYGARLTSGSRPENSDKPPLISRYRWSVRENLIE